MLSWLKRLFGENTDVECAHLVRYTVHSAPCEVCGGPLKDGDLLVGFDTFRGESPEISECKKIAERVVLAHASCLVVIVGTSTEQQPHKSSIALTQQEYDDWLQAASTGSSSYHRVPSVR